MERYIVMGAVRNRNNGEIVQALQKAMASEPQRPTYSEVVIGEIRSSSPVLQVMRDLKPGEVERWADNWLGANSDYADGGALGEWIRSTLKKLSGDEPVSNRKVGKHTAAALEARLLDAMVDCTEIATELSYSKGDAHVRMQKLAEFLDSHTDRSYEFAAFSVPAGSADFGENYKLTMRDASKLSLELISRFPEYADLPTALPADIASPDPFGGEPLLYKKTPHGFVVYSRHENRIDDGYVPIGPEVFEWETVFTKSLNNKDWGLIVAYDPADPLP